MDASLGAAANAAHVVLVQLAQLGLAGGEAGDLGAEGLRADQVDLRVPPYFVALETEIPAGPESDHVNTSPILKYKKYITQKIKSAQCMD